MTDKLRPVSIVFLRKDNSILLAMKKRGFGKGLWNGAGGKPEVGEDILTTAKRECFEEIGVKPGRLQKVAVINFYSQSKPGDSQRAYVYFCEDWAGDPFETEEMRPKWFGLNDIPYESMWSDDKYWLPLVIAGKRIEADFYFDSNNQVLKHTIKDLVN